MYIIYLIYLRKHAKLWACTWPPAPHAGNLPDIACVPMHRKCERHAINPVPALAQESIQEILPYTASGHVMEILNYPVQGLVQDLWSFLYQYWYRKVYRKLCPILYQDMSYKFSTILISAGAKHV